MKNKNHYWLDPNSYYNRDFSIPALTLYHRTYDEDGEYSDEMLGSISYEELDANEKSEDPDGDKIDAWVEEVCPEVAEEGYEVG